MRRNRARQPSPVTMQSAQRDEEEPARQPSPVTMQRGGQGAVMSSDPQTIPAVLDRIARELPDHPALVTPDRTLTFGQLREEVRRPRPR
ncbi:hypothetical protein I553_5680 [Mycobacterium xenopi 4042]|uniref:Uncharacterized protein n=1 Tax=Mycobacterium xenopi 4042 TaxID=1299334 RepID=X7ZV40_MYCXE|nr:hypothetical protein I553_5680 [Mycobacterium xenopi 4042]